MEVGVLKAVTDSTAVWHPLNGWTTNKGQLDNSFEVLIDCQICSANRRLRAFVSLKLARLSWSR